MTGGAGEGALSVSFTQSGGFAGLVRGCTLDAATLDPAARAELGRLVDACGSDSFAAGAAESRDRKRYAIEIRRGDERITIECDDATFPDRARPLAAFLAGRAGPITPRSP